MLPTLVGTEWDIEAQCSKEERKILSYMLDNINEILENVVSSSAPY